MKWYKRDPAAALEGMLGLTAEERGYYNTLIDLLYDRDGDVTDELVIKAMACNPRSWWALKKRLIEKGKVWATADGKLMAKRVEYGLNEARLYAERQSKRARIRWQKQQNQQVTDAIARNASTTTTTVEVAKKLPLRSEPKGSAAKKAAGDPARADLFHRGKQILGPSAGGQITKLLDRMQGSVPRARAIIENAAAAGSPAEYVGAVIRGRQSAPEQDQDRLLLEWCKKNGVGGCDAQEIPLILEDMNGGKPYVRERRTNGHHS